MGSKPHPDKPDDDRDPNTLIDAIADVMRPGGAWISGPCPAPTEPEPDLSEDES